MHIVLLTALFTVCVGVAAVYGFMASWRRYAAGRAIMWLLWALSAATGYWLLARFVPPGVKPWLSNGTGLFMALAVLGVGRVIVIEQLAGYKNRASIRASKIKTEESK